MANLYKPAGAARMSDANSGYMPHLDGWRGVAILCVVAAHFFGDYKLARIGWAGVNCFFILSGYLITGRLSDNIGERAGKYFKVFYIRRILRIFPLYYGCMVFFFLLLPLFYNHYFKNFSELYRHQEWYWLYINNWYIVIYGHPSNITLDVYWSLAVEEQFYLCWPFLFRYIKGGGLKAVMLCLIGVSITGRLWAPSPSLIYFSTLTACEPLLLGAFICIIEREGRLISYARFLIPAGLLSLLLLVFVFLHDSETWMTNSWLIQYGYTGINCGLACLLYASLLPGGLAEILRKVLTVRGLVWVGRYSYGIYIFHWLLFTTFVHKAELEMVGLGINAVLTYWLTRLGGIAVVLAGAYISYHLFEKKFLRLKKYFV